MTDTLLAQQAFFDDLDSFAFEEAVVEEDLQVTPVVVVEPTPTIKKRAKKTKRRKRCVTPELPVIPRKQEVLSPLCTPLKPVPATIRSYGKKNAHNEVDAILCQLQSTPAGKRLKELEKSEENDKIKSPQWKASSASRKKKKPATLSSVPFVEVTTSKKYRASTSRRTMSSSVVKEDAAGAGGASLDTTPASAPPPAAAAALCEEAERPRLTLSLKKKSGGNKVVVLPTRTTTHSPPSAATPVIFGTKRTHAMSEEGVDELEKQRLFFSQLDGGELEAETTIMWKVWGEDREVPLPPAPKRRRVESSSVAKTALLTRYPDLQKEYHCYVKDITGLFEPLSLMEFAEATRGLGLLLDPVV